MTVRICRGRETEPAIPLLYGVGSDTEAFGRFKIVASNPDGLVLDKLFTEFAKAEYPNEPVDDVFGKFSVQQLIKPREMTPDELAAGIVDGAKDGGVDSFYVFINGALVDVDDPLLDEGSGPIRALAPNPEIEVFVVQSKNSSSWKETVWEHLLFTLPKVLDLNANDSDLETLYNSSLVERTAVFRRAVLALATKFPRVTFRTIYVARALEANISDTIKSRAEQVKSAVRASLTGGATVTVEHVGIAGLYKLAGTSYSDPGQLKFRSLLREPGSFLGVVSLDDYLSFVRDKSGALRDELFDSNVRDYEGDNIVNEAIGQTLATSDGVEFWWQNNGVTVLGDRVDSPQQVLTISRPLVVNGLQTSHVLHRAANSGKIDPARLQNGIVVRVIESTDEDVRDRIIAGTNRQTQVPTPALYATRPNQIRIEKYLLANDLYYERRKNRYRNQGQSAKKRVTMNLLAQSMIATLLVRPDDARARPSTLLSRATGYDSIFPDSLDLEAYLRAIELLRGVDDYLRTPAAKTIMDDFTNARFYLVTGYAILRMKTPKPENLHFDVIFRKLKVPLVKSTLAEALTVLAKTAKTYKRSHPESSRDSMFKSSDFRDRYFVALARSLHAQTTPMEAAGTGPAAPAKTVTAKKTTAEK